ncbi:PhzF family phenazine biosynthesis protein [Natronobacterium gregoryi]|uniref:Phenazine biosynthesis protein PhzF family n=2 Tax=Natronobacterium gregoryi TaxID=44930 RepID=L0ALZ3_NATGS|nr:PhzF family phenazine biosynthesis protein [Natronobacterium gregoryi]AFZ74187.1 phenazine biosynthesis protein PhzF family [Natronobacterium gregoryi SP2]ELY63643.1 phenazine biosynthesis protein PhzF family [Natronobacterium gregoryi SP2]PLK22022.1 PhzF family phenazine biosynthesis protein [Natronobacterium gregoryi SP2]SFI51104.1 phenazine biosynthesis protein PhzF family [Natronobacterium gregoryi]
METIRLFQVDAFTDDPLAGNPAGVVPDADGLTDDQMQAIADEMAVSETAFLRSSDDADYRIRYFTPTQEVDLCGHATIGSFTYLHDREGLEPGTITLETNVGVLKVDVEEDGTVWLTQDAPQVREVDVGYDRVADALGVDEAALEGASDDIPLAVSSTGLAFLIVPITYLSDLGAAEPDTTAIESLAESVDAAGVYVFSFDTLAGESSLHGRMFAPGAGVTEDPVTGTASGAVGAYLDRFGAFDDDFPDELRLEQGHYVDRPGVVRVRVGDEVQVGGRGVVVLEGAMVVPPTAEDEILEA